MQKLSSLPALATGDCFEHRRCSLSPLTQCQNIRRLELGLWCHQRIVQVRAEFPSVRLPSAAPHRRSPPPFFSGWSALESPNLGSFGISQVPAPPACVFVLQFTQLQNDAGYVSGSSIAAAALGINNHLRAQLCSRSRQLHRHHRLGSGC
jgi:hypothetical protein